MEASLEFILGILDEHYPAFASHDDFTGPHGRALQLWQRRGFLACGSGRKVPLTCD